MENTVLPPPGTNYLHRSYTPTPVTAIPVSESPHKPGKAIPILILLVVLLLVSNIGAWGYIFLLSGRVDQLSQHASRSALTLSEIAEGSTLVPSDQVVSTVQTVEDTGITLPGNEIQTADAHELTAAFQQQMQAAIGQPDSIYSKALGSAGDAKRRADLSVIGTTINFYLSEQGTLPPDFPTQQRCIGTDKGCYDLFKYVVPEYMESPVMDPSGGTTGNTKYTIAAATDGISTVILQAIGSDAAILEVKK